MRNYNGYSRRQLAEKQQNNKRVERLPDNLETALRWPQQITTVITLS